MTTEDDARRYLAEQMDRRKDDLLIQWEDVAREMSVSIAQLRRIRNNQAPLTTGTARRIEHALQWEQGTVERLMRGEAPRVAEVEATSSLAALALATVETRRADPFRDPGDLPEWVELTALPAEEAQVLSALYLLTPEERLQLSIVVRQMVAKRKQSNGGAHPHTGRHGQDAG